MAAEINAANQAGIDYWAFVWYSEQDSGMHAAWELYQASSLRHLVKWCMITSIAEFGAYPFSIDGSNRSIDRVLDLLSQDNYQRVMKGRSLVYILWNGSDVTKYFNASTANVSGSLEQFRERAARRRMADPYITIMGSSPTESASLARSLGCDAISSYISSFLKRGPQPFSALEPQVESFWRSLGSTGLPAIPIAMLGWDTRPRLEKPVPWHNSKPVTDPKAQDYYMDASPEEFTRHIQRGIDFVRTHPKECEAQSLLVYSWDECDEGGGILPTHGDPGGVYLRALKSVQ